MKLYHISLDLSKTIEDFIPRIPKDKLENEDRKTKRVSLSKSIEGCLTAVPWGGSRLENLHGTKKYVKNSVENEDGFEAIQIRVYEFEVKKEDFISPNELFKKDLVRDAMESKEYWVLKPIKPTKVYDIILDGWGEESFDRLSYQDIQDLNKGMDYEEVWDGTVGSRIVNTEYKKIPAKNI